MGGVSTTATNLATPDTNGFEDVVATNLQSGQHVRVSAAAGGGQANQASYMPTLSSDGCAVAFASNATNLVASDDKVAQMKAFVRDHCTPGIEIVSLSNDEVQGAATLPQISGDGCQVAFVAGSILRPVAAASSGVGVRDRCAGVTSRVDVATAGDPANGGAGTLAISTTGRYIAFAHSATNLVAGDTNDARDIFVRDRATNVAPVAALSITTQGRRVTADAAASRDADGASISAQIAFGDGTPPTAGLQAVHDYARGGIYTVTATVTDADGAIATRSVPVTIADAPPPPPPASPPALPSHEPPAAQRPPLVLDRIGLSRSRFAVLAPGRRPSGSRGAWPRSRLSDAAIVELRFSRAQPGRRVSGRCLTGRRRGRSCTRNVPVGTLRRSLGAGPAALRLTGRVAGRALRPGRHRLLVVGRSADARRSASTTLTFTITEPSSR